jgi:aminoglycoside phosphotransferase (APT) family kinase protein
VPTIATPRDPDDVRARFARWLARRRAASVEVDECTSPSTGGMSSETFLVRAVVARAGRTTTERLVLRLPPSGEGLFPRYDLGAQARLLASLRAATDVPVPRVEAYEPDPAPLGAPFLVMEEALGRIPTDQPSYLHAGWLHDAQAPDQERLHRSFLSVVARVHRVDPTSLGGDAPVRPGVGSPLARDLEWWASYLDWAARDEPASAARGALAWCRDHVPVAEPEASLLWGDVRIPNVVFGDDLAPVAVLDWEMATTGPAEVDLGWYLAIHRMSTVAGDLPGFLSRERTVDWYEANLGRPLARDALHWFETYGALRSTAIMVRMAHLLADLGVLPDRGLVERNPCTALLDELLG